MGTKLRAKSAYTNGPRNLSFQAGEEFMASDNLVPFLMADAPGSFELVDETPKAEEATEEVAKDVETPPVDKMVKRPKAKK